MQLAILGVIALFLLGPERIPTAVRFVSDASTKLRGLLTGAQDGLRRELGPELAELRAQIAELQSLRELPELRELQQLRELHPKRLLAPSPAGRPVAPATAGTPVAGTRSATA
jgi:sec-independent protein translocase protein TatB